MAFRIHEGPDPLRRRSAVSPATPTRFQELPREIYDEGFDYISSGVLDEVRMNRSWGDVGRSLGANVPGVLGAIGGAVNELSSALEGGGTSAGERIGSIVRDRPVSNEEALKESTGASHAILDYRDEMLEGRSPGAQQAAAGRWSDAGGGPGSAWSDISGTLLHQAGPSIGYMVPTMLATFGTAGSGLAWQAGAAVIAGLVEGGMSGAEAAKDLSDDLYAMPDEEFEKVSGGLTRDEYVKDAASQVFREVGGATAAIGAVGAGAARAFLNKVGIGPGLKQRAKRTAAGAVEEGPLTEGPQGVAEAALMAAAKERAGLDPGDPDYWEKYLAGTAAGSTLGSGFGVMSSGDVDEALVAARDAEQERKQQGEAVSLTHQQLPRLPAPAIAGEGQPPAGAQLMLPAPLPALPAPAEEAIPAPDAEPVSYQVTKEDEAEIKALGEEAQAEYGTAKGAEVPVEVRKKQELLVHMADRLGIELSPGVVGQGRARLDPNAPRETKGIRADRRAPIDYRQLATRIIETARERTTLAPEGNRTLPTEAEAPWRLRGAHQRLSDRNVTGQVAEARGAGPLRQETALGAGQRQQQWAQQAEQVEPQAQANLAVADQIIAAHGLTWQNPYSAPAGALPATTQERSPEDLKQARLAIQALQAQGTPEASLSAEALASDFGIDPETFSPPTPEQVEVVGTDRKPGEVGRASLTEEEWGAARPRINLPEGTKPALPGGAHVGAPPEGRGQTAAPEETQRAVAAGMVRAQEREAVAEAQPTVFQKERRKELNQRQAEEAEAARKHRVSVDALRAFDEKDAFGVADAEKAVADAKPQEGKNAFEKNFPIRRAKNTLRLRKRRRATARRKLQKEAIAAASDLEFARRKVKSAVVRHAQAAQNIPEKVAEAGKRIHRIQRAVAKKKQKLSLKAVGDVQRGRQKVTARSEDIRDLQKQGVLGVFNGLLGPKSKIRVSTEAGPKVLQGLIQALEAAKARLDFRKNEEFHARQRLKKAIDGLRNATKARSQKDLDNLSDLMWEEYEPDSDTNPEEFFALAERIGDAKARLKELRGSDLSGEMTGAADAVEAAQRARAEARIEGGQAAREYAKENALARAFDYYGNPLLQGRVPERGGDGELNSPTRIKRTAEERRYRSKEGRREITDAWGLREQTANEIYTDLARERQSLLSVLQALPVMEQVRPGTFKTMNALLGRASLGELSPAQFLNQLDKKVTSQFKQADEVRLQELRASSEKALNARMDEIAEVMRPIEEKAQEGIDNANQRVADLEAARNKLMVAQQRESVLARKGSRRAGASLWAAFQRRKGSQYEATVKDIAQVMRDVGYDAHADAISAKRLTVDHLPMIAKLAPKRKKTPARIVKLIQQASEKDGAQNQKWIQKLLILDFRAALPADKRVAMAMRTAYENERAAKLGNLGVDEQIAEAKKEAAGVTERIEKVEDFRRAKGTRHLQEQLLKSEYLVPMVNAAYRARQVAKSLRGRTSISPGLQALHNRNAAPDPTLVESLRHLMDSPPLRQPGERSVVNIDGKVKALKPGQETALYNALADFFHHLDTTALQAGTRSPTAEAEIREMLGVYRRQYTGTLDTGGLEGLAERVAVRAAQAFKGKSEVERVEATREAERKAKKSQNDQDRSRDWGVDSPAGEPTPGGDVGEEVAAGGGEGAVGGRRSPDEVFGPSEDPPERSRLLDGIAALEPGLTEKQVLAVESIHEGLQRGKGFILNDEQGYGKTLEMLAGAIQAIAGGGVTADIESKRRNHRVLVLTPARQRFLDDVEKFGLQKLLDEHHIDLIISKNAYTDMRVASFLDQDGEEFAKMPELAVPGQNKKAVDLFIYDEVHETANPNQDETISSSFNLIKDVLNVEYETEDGGVYSPKVIFSTGTFAASPKNTWPIPIVRGESLDSWWQKLGVKLVAKVKNGELKETKVVSLEGKTSDSYWDGVADHILAEMNDLANNYQLVRRMLNAPRRLETETPVSGAAIEQAYEDLGAVYGRGDGQMRQSLAALNSWVTEESPRQKAAMRNYFPQIAELVKTAVAARQAADAVIEGKKPVVIVGSTQTQLKFGGAAEELGLPTMSVPGAFKKIYARVLEENNASKSDYPVVELHRGGTTPSKVATAAARFQAGDKATTLLASYNMAATGIDLHDAPGVLGDPGPTERLLILPHLPFDYFKFQQASARVARRGQRSVPTIRLLHSAKEFQADEMVLPLAKKKAGFFDKLSAYEGMDTGVVQDEEKTGSDKLLPQADAPLYKDDVIIHRDKGTTHRIRLTMANNVRKRARVANRLRHPQAGLKERVYTAPNGRLESAFGYDADHFTFEIRDSAGSTENYDAFMEQLDRAMRYGGKMSQADTAAVNFVENAKLGLAELEPASARVAEFASKVSLTHGRKYTTLDQVLRVLGDGKEDVAEIAQMIQALRLEVDVEFDADINTPAKYDLETRTVRVHPKMGDHPVLANLILHEAYHAATVHGLRVDPRLREEVDGIRQAVVRQAIKEKLIPDDISRALIHGLVLSQEQRKALADKGLYGLTDPDEFAAEAMLAQEMINLLRRTQVGRWPVLQRMVRAFLKYVDRLFGSTFADTPSIQNAMSDVIEMRNRLFQTEAGAKASWELQRSHLGFGPATNFELGEQAAKLRDAVDPIKQKYIDPNVRLPGLFTRETGRKAQIFLESQTDILNRMRTRAKRSFDSGETEDRPTLRGLANDFAKAKALQGQEQVRQLKRSEDEIETWDRELRKDPTKMARMHDHMIESTIQEWYLDKEWNDPAHQHLREFRYTDKDGVQQKVGLTPAQEVAAQAAFQKAKDSFDAAGYTKAQLDIYKNTYESTAKRWAEISDALLHNVLSHHLPQADDAEIAKMAAGFQAAGKVAKDYVVLGENGTPLRNQKSGNAVAFREQINRVLGATAVSGPYFPLRREGKHVVSARKYGEEQVFASKAARNAAMRDMRVANKAIKFTTKSDSKQKIFSFTPYEYQVEMFESRGEASQWATKMREDKWGVTGPQIRAEFTQEPGALTGLGLERALEKLPKGSRTAVLNFYLDMYPGTSIKHSTRHRKKVLGASREMFQAYAKYVSASSNHIAQLRHGMKIARVIRAMKKVMSNITGKGNYREPDDQYVFEMETAIGELERRENDYSLAVETAWDLPAGISRFMFLHTLAQPAFILMNATQVPLATAPVLAGRFGVSQTHRAMNDTLGALLPDVMRRMGGTMKAFGRPTKAPSRAFFEFLQENADGTLGIGEEIANNIRKSNVPYKDDLVRAMTALGEMGRLDLTLSAVVHQAKKQSGTRMSRATNQLMELARGPVQVVETGNRMWAGAAAYTLFRNANVDKPAYTDAAEQLHEDAVAYAAQVIDETQVNYSEADAPRWMSRSGPLGQFAPLLFMYKRYAWYMHMNFVRNAYRAVFTSGVPEEEVKAARRTVAYLTATHVAAAGALGLPQSAKMLASLVWGLLGGGGEDDPRNFDEWARAGMAEIFGETGGEVLAHGLPRLFNSDFGAGLGLDNAFMYTDQLRGKYGEDLLASAVMSFGGPLAGLAGRMLAMPEFIENGQVDRALEVVMPKVMRSVFQAVRFSNEGITDRAGDVTMAPRDISGWELLQKGIGINPGDVSEFYTGREAVRAARDHFRRNRSALITRWRSGQRGPAFWRAVEDYNATVPSESLKVTRDVLDAATKRGSTKLDNRFGINIPKTQSEITQYGDPYNF